MPAAAGLELVLNDWDGGDLEGTLWKARGAKGRTIHWSDPLEAADVLTREAAVLFRALGREMLNTLGKLFLSIQHEVDQVTLNPHMSREDRDERLARIREHTQFGRKAAAELLAMAPHVGPRT